MVTDEEARVTSFHNPWQGFKIFAIRASKALAV